MQRFWLTLALGVPALAQPPIRYLEGAGAPPATACDSTGERGAIYLRYDNPATNPSQVYVCTQTGASSYAWQFISHKIGSSNPAKCDLGEVFFNTAGSAGQNWYGCTAADTWTLMSGGGGGSGNPAGYTTVPYSATPTFTAASNTATSFLITLTGNVTSSTLAGASTGQLLTFNVCEDATGGRTFVWPTTIPNHGDIDTTANACSHQTFVWDGTNAQVLGNLVVTGVNGGSVDLPGANSGSLKIKPAANAGSNSVLTLPGGTTDFSATGGTSQVVKQTSPGSPFTVGTMGCADLSDASSGCSAPAGSGSGSVPYGLSVIHIGYASAVADIASTANGACTAVDVAVKDAFPGDRVYVNGAALADGVFPEAKVTAYGNARLQVCNLTGTANDPPSTTYNFTLVRPS